MGDPKRRYGRSILAILGAALAAGLVVGLGARMLMRAIALALGHDGGFSLVGTSGIVMVFIAFAVPAAATAAATSTVIRTGGRWITAGVAGWACARTGISDAQTVVFAEDDRLMLIAALATVFGALVVGFGQLAQYLMRRMAGLPRPAAPARPPVLRTVRGG